MKSCKQEGCTNLLEGRYLYCEEHRGIVENIRRYRLKNSKSLPLSIRTCKEEGCTETFLPDTAKCFYCPVHQGHYWAVQRYRRKLREQGLCRCSRSISSSGRRCDSCKERCQKLSKARALLTKKVKVLRTYNCKACGKKATSYFLCSKFCRECATNSVSCKRAREKARNNGFCVVCRKRQIAPDSIALCSACAELIRNRNRKNK